MLARRSPARLRVCPTLGVSSLRGRARARLTLPARAMVVVIDGGGLTSHSAIVAREYGILCVVGTRIGTGTSRDGGMVTVDGHAGAVTITR